MSDAPILAGGDAAIDQHVGARIRLRRRDLGISQGQLADDLGITFQQVQKYERGANRVSASKLFAIARALKTTTTWFFDGLPGADASPAETATDRLLSRFLLTPGVRDLIAALPDVPRGPQAQLIGLARELAAIATGRDDAADEDDDDPALAALIANDASPAQFVGGGWSDARRLDA